MESGYPPPRIEPQRIAREKLAKISTQTHRKFPEIIETLPDDVILPALEYPGMEELIEVDSITDSSLKKAFLKRMHH